MHVKILSDKLNKQTKFGTSHAFEKLMFHMHNSKFWEANMLGHWCTWNCDILARGGLSLLSISRWPPSTVVSEARVSLSRGQCIHANDDQSWKAMDGGDVVGVAIFPMPKHASRSWRNSKLPLREVFCTLGPSPPSVPERYLEVMSKPQIFKKI